MPSSHQLDGKKISKWWNKQVARSAYNNAITYRPLPSVANPMWHCTALATQRHDAVEKCSCNLTVKLIHWKDHFNLSAKIKSVLGYEASFNLITSAHLTLHNYQL